jgi:hypothetical protein
MAKAEVEMCAVYGVIFMFVNAFGAWFRMAMISTLVEVEFSVG